MRCLLCGVLLNECDELKDINEKSPFSKKSFLSIVKYLAKTAKPPGVVTWTNQFNECYICQTCCFDILKYDEYMVKLLEVQKRIISYLRNPVLSEELIAIQTLDECIDESNVKIEEFEIGVERITEECFSVLDNNNKSFVEENENTETIGDGENIKEFNYADETESDKAEDPTVSLRKYNIPVKCDICCKVFKNKTHLNRHMNVAHKPSKQVWKCEVCGITAKDEEYLELHRNIHEGRSDLECRFCNKRYSRKINVIRHMHKHWDKKNVQCERCGLRFSELPVYYNHKLQHDAEDDPLICTVCNQSFKTRRTYRNHLWVHRDDRPRYSCEICGKTFVEKYTLKVHLRCHSDGGKRKNNISINQEEKTLECVICGDQFSSKDLYNQHMEIQHDVILNAEDI
ncbi:serendipity locus protein delta-like [Zeugodacus cucurbitae]|uniref:serendipity locus protein delta-like n=1 Tax=Zeugodacus cucurbitae TaxID=28588 RepID=UPI0023D95D13|nr:serendipity locus protein delta-like [Zeugodacus cucurbitae]